MDSRLPQPLSAADMSNEWPRWKQTFLIYIRANDLSDKNEEIKIAKFLWLIGDHGLQIYNTLYPNDGSIEDMFNHVPEKTITSDADEPKQTLANVLKSFDSFCLPRRNLAMESFKFHSMNQKEKQPFAEYETALRTQMQSCAFDCDKCKSSFAERMLRDRIILGVSEKSLQMKLLDGKYDSLSEVIDACKVYEAATENKRLLQSTTSELKANIIDSEAKQAAVDLAQKSVPKCFNCGYPFTQNHRRNCRAAKINCRSCGQLGHFQKFCRATNGGSMQQESKRKLNEIVGVANSAAGVTSGANNSISKVDWNTGNSKRSNSNAHRDSNVNSYFAFDGNSRVEVISDSCVVGSVSSWYVSLQINGQSLQFKLDTGADISCVPIGFIKKVGLKDRMSPTKLIVTDYNSNKITVYGSIDLNCVVVDTSVTHSETFYVVDDCREPIIGVTECKSFGLLRKMDAIRNFPALENDFIDQFRDVFEGLGKLPGSCTIRLKENSVPVLRYKKRIPFAIMDQLKSELERLVELKIISVVDYPTDWVNNLQIVERPGKDIRICLDPKPLNECIRREHFLIPTAEDITSRLSGKRVFSVLDLRNGFWQMELDSRSADLTTFMTPFGRYRWERVPFGLNCAPEMFQKKMDQIFGDIPNVEIYFDDMFVSGVDCAEHDETLSLVLDRARKNNVKFNSSKIQYRKEIVKFMGNIISLGSIRPDDKYLKAIKEMDLPTDKSGVKRLLGLFKYLGRFIPNLSQRSANLRNLTHDDTEWHWSSEHAGEMCDLLLEISKKPVLAIYRPSDPIVIQTDSSKNGLGSVILQNGQPVAFASRSLTASEQKWAQIEKELLAIVFACERFHHFLYGRTFVVQSDHKPLEALFKREIDDVTARLQRMFLRLLKYPGLSIVYTPGKEMLVADCLSRASLKKGDPDDPDCKLLEGTVHAVIQSVCMSQSNYDLYVETIRSDEKYCRIVKYVQWGWPAYHKLDDFSQKFHKVKDELHFEDGVLFRNHRTVVPSQLQPKILKVVHEAHLGIEKTLAYARERFYWPNMSAQVKQLVQSCAVCEQFTRSNQKEPLRQDKSPEYPWQRISVDVFEYAGRYFIAIIDAYSGFLICKGLANKTSRHIIDVFLNIFAYFGYPTQIRADNSPFGSREFEDFANSSNIIFTFSSPRYAQSNGLAEKGVSIAKNIVKRCCEENKLNEIDYRVLLYNTIPVASMKMSPSQLFFGRQIKCKIPMAGELLKRQMISEPEVQKKIEKKKLVQKQYYDRQAKPLPLLNIGDRVIFKKNGKEWYYGKIARKRSDRSYIIVDDSGSYFRRNRRHISNAHSGSTNLDESLRGEHVNRHFSHTKEGMNVMHPNIRNGASHDRAPTDNGLGSNSDRSMVVDEPVFEGSSVSDNGDASPIENSHSGMYHEAMQSYESILEPAEFAPTITGTPYVTRTGRTVNPPSRYGDWT